MRAEHRTLVHTPGGGTPHQPPGAFQRRTAPPAKPPPPPDFFDQPRPAATVPAAHKNHRLHQPCFR